MYHGQVEHHYLCLFERKINKGIQTIPQFHNTVEKLHIMYILYITNEDNNIIRVHSTSIIFNLH